MPPVLQTSLPGMGAKERLDLESITLASPVQLAPDGEPPAEFRIFAAGNIDTTKGVFLFDKGSQKSVKKEFRATGIDALPVDYDHKIPLGSFGGEGSGKAAGWFKPEMRPNGELWATNVEWTPTAAQALRDREYRFTSPAFWTLDMFNLINGRPPAKADGNRIMKLINVALVNIPGTKRAKPLINSGLDDLGDGVAGNNEETIMKTLLSKLSLPETATEAEAVTSLSALVSAHEAQTAAHTEQLSTLLSATGEESVEAAVGAIAAGKAAVGQVAELSAKLEGIEKARETDERAGIVTQLKADKKLTPAQEKDLVPALSLDGLKAFAKSAPVVIGKSANEEPSGDGKVGSAARLSHEGKTYEQLSGTEKAALRDSDRPAFDSLRNDWINAGQPVVAPPKS